MRLKVVLEDGIEPPRYATKRSAGLDLRAKRGLTLWPGFRELVGTGIRLELPREHVGLICPRSGRARDYGLTVLNAPGIIDEDYRGEVGVLLVNLGSDPIPIRSGDRIAQLVVVPVARCEVVVVEELPDTGRGSGGFGSTGR